MTLKPGQLAEYRQRHDENWPDLADALRLADIKNYSIHHDPQTDVLFATLCRDHDHFMDAVPATEVMQRWCADMAPSMEVNPDGSP